VQRGPELPPSKAAAATHLVTVLQEAIAFGRIGRALERTAHYPHRRAEGLEK